MFYILSLVQLFYFFQTYSCLLLLCFLVTCEVNHKSVQLRMCGVTKDAGIYLILAQTSAWVHFCSVSLGLWSWIFPKFPVDYIITIHALTVNESCGQLWYCSTNNMFSCLHIMRSYVYVIHMMLFERGRSGFMRRGHSRRCMEKGFIVVLIGCIQKQGVKSWPMTW